MASAALCHMRNMPFHQTQASLLKAVVHAIL